MKKHYRKSGVIFGVAALVYILDRLSKIWVETHIPIDGRVTVIPGLTRYVSLTHWQNRGVAFGLMPGNDFLVLLIVAVLFLAVYLYLHFLPLEDLVSQILVGMQLGGALGNLTDRYLHGAVTDFVLIGVPWQSRVHYWPAFNVADASISTGVFLLILYILWSDSRSAREEHGQPTASFPAENRAHQTES